MEVNNKTITPRNLKDILNTLTEIIQNERNKTITTITLNNNLPSSTEYFIIIITTLSSASSIEKEYLNSLLYILNSIINKVNINILQLQFQLIYNTILYYLNQFEENNNIRSYCYNIIGYLLEFQEVSESFWRNQNMLKIINLFLKNISEQNDKVRKIIHQRLTGILQRHAKFKVNSVRSYIADFCNAILQSCNHSNYKRSLQILIFLQQSLIYFNSSEILNIFQLFHSIQECEQPILIAQIYRTIDSFFQSPSTYFSDNSFQQLIPEVLSMLIKNLPNTRDMEAIAFYCTSLASGLVALHHITSNSFWNVSNSNIHHPIIQITSILLIRCESEYAQIHCAVGTALKRIISSCFDSNSLSSQIINDAIHIIELGSQTSLNEHILGQFLNNIKGLLQLRFQHAWIFVLDPIRVLFSHLPGYTGKILLGDMVQTIADLYHAISTGVMTVSTGIDLSIQETLGTIIRSLTLEHFISLIPLRRLNHNLTSDLDTSRDWIINLLHTNLKLMPCKLNDFNTIILPIAKEYNSIVRASNNNSGNNNNNNNNNNNLKLNDSQLSILRTKVIQLWSLFPNFCNSSLGPPIDTVKALPSLIPILDAVLKDSQYPELLLPVVTGLTSLATSIKEKYPKQLPTNILPKDLEILQVKLTPILIPTLLSLLEGMDVSTDSTKFQPSVTCISALASVAAPNMISKVSKRLLQLLLSSTDSNSISESTAASWLAVILALIPYQSEQMIILLYRTIKPLLSVHESVSMQKRAYKVLHGLLISHSECLFKLEPKKQILDQITESLLTCHVSARHIRLMCVSSLLEGIILEEKKLPSGTDQLSQACSQIFGETLICLKDSNKKTRDAALHLLKIIYSSLPTENILPHLYAGIVGETPAMRSAALIGLCILIQNKQSRYRKNQYNNDNDNNDIESEDENENVDENVNENEESYNQLIESIGQLLPTILLLLQEESIEETRSILAFTKICVNVLPIFKLIELLPIIFSSILGDGLGSEENKLKSKFSSKLRSIVRKAWQRVGEEQIRPLIPLSDIALLDYIERQGRRTKSRQEKNKKSTGIDRIIHNESDEDSDSSDDDDNDNNDNDNDDNNNSNSTNNKKLQQQKLKSKRDLKASRPKAIKATDFIGEGLPSTLSDLLEDQSGPLSRSKSNNNNNNSNNNNNEDNDDNEEYTIQVTKEGKLVLVPKETKESLLTVPNEGMELENEGDKSIHSKNNDEKSENPKKRVREPGEEYRSKRAGGDVWKKGMLEPHAYIPLDARLLTKKNQKNAIAHIGIAVQNATKRRLKEEQQSSYDITSGSKKVSTMISRKQRRAQMKDKDFLFQNSKSNTTFPLQNKQKQRERKMALLERKKIRTKKWSTIYIERTSNINDNEIQKKIDKEEVRDFLGGIWARTMIAKKMSKVIKHKIRQKSHSCKKSLLNLHYPIAPSDWNKHWGSQLMCSICNSPAIYDSIICNTCDTIVHITCVENNPDGDHMIIRRDETDEEDASMEYYCSYCKEHEILEKNYYNKELSRLKYERHLKQMVNRIISILKTRIDRARFLKQRQLAIALQALARRHNIRRKFHQIRRNQIRVILLDIVSLPKIDGACMIVWTVVDKFKNHQLFRMDKEINRALIEGFLIPGTSANVSIYMTIIRSEGQNLFFAGQCQIALRDVNPFEENQVHTLTVSENIEWHPQETRVEKLVFQLPIPVHAHSSTSLYSPLYHEDTQLNVLITPGTAPSTAGAVNTPGGIGEGLLGLTNSENDQQGIGNDLKVTNNDIHQQRVLTSQTSLPSNDIMASNSMTGLSIASLTATAPRMVAQIRYNAVSTVTSYCAHIQGPPLDVLRRTADHYYHNTRNKNNSAAERKTKWWICLVELNLLFYQYLGDTKPRYAVYVADANAYVPKDNVNSGSSALLLFSDKRKWLLDFETPFEAKRFVYTMNESKKAMEGTSIFFKHQKQFSAKFIIH